MLNEILSAVIFLVFSALLMLGAASTALRWFRYIRQGIPAPVLLKRDAALLGGLAAPFLLISFVRALGLSAVVTSPAGVPELWWLLITGLPAIFAVTVYVWYEIFVIERRPRK